MGANIIRDKTTSNGVMFSRNCPTNAKGPPMEEKEKLKTSSFLFSPMILH